MCGTRSRRLAEAVAAVQLCKASVPVPTATVCWPGGGGLLSRCGSWRWQGNRQNARNAPPHLGLYECLIHQKWRSMGEQTLAADGRSFTDVNWNSGKEDEKTTGVYVKQ